MFAFILTGRSSPDKAVRLPGRATLPFVFMVKSARYRLRQELPAMFEHDKLVQWAVELQSLAQIGLTYTTNVYDRERFERIREISAEIMSEKTGWISRK
jgi:hypothetical protein